MTIISVPLLDKEMTVYLKLYRLTTVKRQYLQIHLTKLLHKIEKTWIWSNLKGRSVRKMSIANFKTLLKHLRVEVPAVHTHTKGKKIGCPSFLTWGLIKVLSMELEAKMNFQIFIILKVYPNTYAELIHRRRDIVVHDIWRKYLISVVHHEPH